MARVFDKAPIIKTWPDVRSLPLLLFSHSSLTRSNMPYVMAGLEHSTNDARSPFQSSVTPSSLMIVLRVSTNDSGPADGPEGDIGEDGGWNVCCRVVTIPMGSTINWQRAPATAPRVNSMAVPIDTPSPILFW